MNSPNMTVKMTARERAYERPLTKEIERRIKRLDSEPFERDEVSHIRVPLCIASTLLDLESHYRRHKLKKSDIFEIATVRGLNEIEHLYLPRLKRMGTLRAKNRMNAGNWGCNSIEYRMTRTSCRFEIPWTFELKRYTSKSTKERLSLISDYTGMTFQTISTVVLCYAIRTVTHGRRLGDVQRIITQFVDAFTTEAELIDAEATVIRKVKGK